MKCRSGFVSNSSSSSFICDVCGRNESGWDIGLEEVDMYFCSNGHTFCRSEAMYDVENDPAQVVLDAKVELVGDEDDTDLAEILDELCYNMPPNTCPICMMKHVQDHHLLQWVTMKCTGLDRPLLVADFKEEFNNDYPTFEQWRRKTYGEYTGHIDGKVPD